MKTMTSWFTLGLCLITVVLATSAAAAEASPNPYLAQAKVLYQGLDFEKCVQRLDRALRWPSTAAEQADVEIYRALCGLNLGEKEEVKQHFRVALRFYPDALLPAFTPPKIVQQFREVWAEMHPGRAVPERLTDSGRPAPAPVPQLAPAPAPLLATERSEAPPGGGPNRMRLASYVLMGAGVAAVGGGILFGVSASNAAAAEKTSTSFRAKSSLQNNAYARGQIADILYIAGGALAATGVVLWVVSPRDDRPAVGVTPTGVSVSGVFP